MINRSLLVTFFACCMLPAALSAQDDPLADDSTRGWKKSAVIGLSITQAAYSNWKAGGDDNYAGKGNGNFLFEHFSESFYVANLLQLAYGRSWNNELGWRKIDDVIRYNFLMAYRSSATIKPTLTIDFRTQFADGFNYDLSEDGVRVSTFMAPGYLTETAGLLYVPNDWLSTVLGLAAKQTFVLEESLRDPDDPSFEDTNGYGNAPDESVRNEVGLNLNAVAAGEAFTNVLVRSELGIFAAFNQIEHPDIRWNNLVQLKVNDWLNTTFEFEIFYDNDQSTEIQWRQLLAVGVAFNLL